MISCDRRPRIASIASSTIAAYTARHVTMAWVAACSSTEPRPHIELRVCTMVPMQRTSAQSCAAEHSSLSRCVLQPAHVVVVHFGWTRALAVVCCDLYGLYSKPAFAKVGRISCSHECCCWSTWKKW
jgi:hypothetical protein